MKPYNFTLQKVGSTFSSADSLLDGYKPSVFLSFIFLLFSLFSFSRNPLDVTTGKTGISNCMLTNAPLTGKESIRTTLYLLNSNNTTILADGVYTEYNDLYHDSVLLEDAYKFTNINENLGIVRHGAVLSVERRPVIVKNDTLFFKLWKTSKRNYQFEFTTTNLDHPGMQAVLQDSYLGTSLPLALNGITKLNFVVNADVASADVNRFKIVYVTNIAAATLPVTFTSIKGFEINKKMAIEWKVENEINIKRYEVERSSNGTDFNTLSSITVSGFKNSFNSYSWIDNQPLSSNSFYRIKSVDMDGTEKFSVIVKMTTGKTSSGSIVIYPNPIQGNIINLQFTNQMTGLYQLRLINNNGQVVYSSSLVVNSPNSSQTIMTNTKLNYGIYQLEIKAPDNMVQLKRAIVQ
jgi:hypothetical protein